MSLTGRLSWEGGGVGSQYFLRAGKKKALQDRFCYKKGIFNSFGRADSDFCRTEFYRPTNT